MYRIFVKAINTKHGFKACLLALTLIFGLGGAGPLAPLPASAQETAGASAPDFLYAFPVPEGWRKEVVTFPLSFAPELDYTGHGDVRFSPGMFNAGADDFWTYSFIWWVPLDTEVSAARLSTDMNAYFSGLAALVTEMGERDLPVYEAAATYFENPHTTGPSLVGTIKTLDAFATHAPIALYSQIDETLCPQHERKAIHFSFSPQDFGDAQWNALEQVKNSFTCDRAD